MPPVRVPLAAPAGKRIGPAPADCAGARRAGPRALDRKVPSAACPGWRRLARGWPDRAPARRWTRAPRPPLPRGHPHASPAAEAAPAGDLEAGHAEAAEAPQEAEAGEADAPADAALRAAGTGRQVASPQGQRLRALQRARARLSGSPWPGCLPAVRVRRPEVGPRVWGGGLVGSKFGG